jgi:RNA polymerase sigma factor (sigma-70 family)
MEAARTSALLDHEQSFERLYRQHRADVYRFVLRDTGNREEAEDVTQTAFLNAYNAFIRSGPPEKPKAWLFAIAENVKRRRYRTQSRRPAETPLEYEPAADGADEDIPTAREIGAALAALPFNQRTALALRELGGLSYSEIAEELGLSVAAVQMLIFRARRALRAELEPVTVPGRVLGGLLGFPVPSWLARAVQWLGSLVERGGLLPRAAGVVGAAVVGTSVVAGNEQSHALPDVLTRGEPAQVAERSSSAPAAARTRSQTAQTSVGPISATASGGRRARPSTAAARVRTAPGRAAGRAAPAPAGAQAAPTARGARSGSDSGRASASTSAAAPGQASSLLPKVPGLERPKTPLDQLLPPTLPRLPEAPPLPNVPKLPKLPKVPSVPDLPKAPTLPELPDAPTLPSAPNVPNPQLPSPPVSQPPVPTPPVAPPTVPSPPPVSPPSPPPVSPPPLPPAPSLPPVPPPPKLP